MESEQEKERAQIDVLASRGRGSRNRNRHGRVCQVEEIADFGIQGEIRTDEVVEPHPETGREGSPRGDGAGEAPAKRVQRGTVGKTVEVDPKSQGSVKGDVPQLVGPQFDRGKK